MLIEGVEIKKKSVNDNIIMMVNNEEYIITPEIIAKSWGITATAKYDKIKLDDPWTHKVMKHIIKNPNSVFLVALLLSR